MIAMAEQMQLNRSSTVREPIAVVEDLCPRCDSEAVRVIVYGPLDIEVEAIDADEVVDSLAESPIFDCRDCGFEWGLAVRDILA